MPDLYQPTAFSERVTVFPFVEPEPLIVRFPNNDPATRVTLPLAVPTDDEILKPPSGVIEPVTGTIVGTELGVARIVPVMLPVELTAKQNGAVLA